ncbi:hypothetical protein NHX12_007308, partial [Muraenolepis orangiensis]
VSEEANSQLEGPLTIQELQTALQGMQGRRAPAPFRVCRGVRQGCALSGMLYALSLEPLLNKIRSKLQGLFLPGLNGNMVLSVYADDVVVFVRDQKDTDILVDIVRDFSSASAARVNWKKSEALAVGEWSGGLPVLPRNMVWKKDGFKYLGVFLGKEIVVLKNWEDVVEKIEGKLSKWKWLLPQMSFKEPLIHKARLDVSSSEMPGLTVALCRSKTLCLQQLVDAVGPELSDAQALGSLLGLHSVRVAQRILQLWSQILCPEEKRLLRSYGQGRARPDPADPFPEIYLSPGLGELTGPLLQFSPCSLALDQGQGARPRSKAKEQGQGSRAKGAGPRSKAKGAGPREQGQGARPRELGQGSRAKEQGLGSRTKGAGPREKGLGSRAKGAGPREQGQGSRAKGAGPRSKAKGAGPRDQGQGARPREQGQGSRAKEQGLGSRAKGAGPREQGQGSRA